MTKSKILLLVTAIISMGEINAADINTTDPYLIIGSITSDELLKEHETYLMRHPELVNDMDAWVRGSEKLPSNLKFNRVIANPNYIPTPDPEIITLLSQPSAKVFRLNYSPLNQGSMNTCATFVTLGAIQNTNDGLSISPSCTLQMMYTATNRNHWDGSTTDQSITALRNHGYITSSLGNTGFCNASYPTYQSYSQPLGDSQKKLLIDLNTYKSQSTSAANIYHRQYANINDAQNALNMIKNDINNTKNNGVIFDNMPTKTTNFTKTHGLFPTIAFWANQSFNCLDYKSVNINGQIKHIKVWSNCRFEKIASHATFVYGYDNNICINGNECGVLFLRNSWGYDSDNGNFLMTYKYFLENYLPSSNTAYALIAAITTDYPYSYTEYWRP
ncbi:MAG: hypothetical protein K2X04_02785 [Burkholderiales bacterium]|nr:hypothetical protein [Burkholderiales bacterium]